MAVRHTASYEAISLPYVGTGKSAPGNWELVYTKLNEPRYPEIVAVNIGKGLLTKVGSVRGGTGTVVDGDVSRISLEVCFDTTKELAAIENLWLRTVRGSAKTLGKRCYHALFPVAQTIWGRFVKRTRQY